MRTHIIRTHAARCPPSGAILFFPGLSKIRNFCMPTSLIDLHSSRHDADRAITFVPTGVWLSTDDAPFRVSVAGILLEKFTSFAGHRLLLCLARNPCTHTRMHEPLPSLQHLCETKNQRYVMIFKKASTGCLLKVLAVLGCTARQCGGERSQQLTSAFSKAFLTCCQQT